MTTLPATIRVSTISHLTDEQAVALAKKCLENRNLATENVESEYGRCPFHAVPGLLHIGYSKWRRTKWGWFQALAEVRRLEALVRTERLQNAALRKTMNSIYEGQAKRAADLKRTIDLSVGRNPE